MTTFIIFFFRKIIFFKGLFRSLFYWTLPLPKRLVWLNLIHHLALFAWRNLSLSCIFIISRRAVICWNTIFVQVSIFQSEKSCTDKLNSIKMPALFLVWFSHEISLQLKYIYIFVGRKYNSLSLSLLTFYCCLSRYFALFCCVHVYSITVSFAFDKILKKKVRKL